MIGRSRSGAAGLTIVELLVALAISGFVTSATFIFFAGQRRVYETHGSIAAVQQNLWGAMEALTRDIRAAGGGMFGCVRPDADGVGPDTGDPPPTGAAPPATGLRAFRNGTGAVRIAPLWIRNGAAGAPDTLTVAYGSLAFGTYSDATLGATVPLDTPTAPVSTLAGQSQAFRAGEFGLLLSATGGATGDRGCSLFQITAVRAAGDLLEHTPASPWNPAANVAGVVPFTYDGGFTGADGVVRNFGALTWIQYTITPGPPGQPPRLTMNRLDGAAGPQIVAEGIEDLQVAYACDTLPVGAPDGALFEGNTAAARLVDEWVFNTPGDVAPANCQQPSAVRITLFARSLTRDDDLSGQPGNAKPALEDGVAGAPDRFRHRVMTSTVYLRN